MQFDLMNILGFGVVAFAALLWYRRHRGGTAPEEDDRAINQRRDVLRAIKSMQKDS